MTAWDIYLDGQLIDTVFYHTGIKLDEVRRGLIDHDGMSKYIKIKKSGSAGGPK